MNDFTKKLSVLVVDDDNAIHSALRFSFNEAGWDYVGVLAGTEALSLLRERAFSAVIIDGILPDMTGVELCRAARAVPGLVMPPIAFLSAFFKDTSTLRELFVDMGVGIVLHKPRQPREIVRRVCELVKTDCSSSVLTPESMAEFAEIRALYIESFFENARAIESLLEGLESNPGDSISLLSLRNIVHKINGSAGSYGFARVSLGAARWEREILDILDSGLAVSADALRGFCQRFENIKVDFQSPRHSDNDDPDEEPRLMSQGLFASF
ncbi:MAG TPA: response regulator [bacterium]|nr:MAG: Alkaline phosphatase synthesis transcriptional regulatory protein PhoP [bacterium ADurb.Bin236]HOY61675.1 response regulator [bacterium]HPI76808.1 response regulator [bacterium]HPN93258.1 response regulator [bacterium]